MFVVEELEELWWIFLIDIHVRETIDFALRDYVFLFVSSWETKWRHACFYRSFELHELKTEPAVLSFHETSHVRVFSSLKCKDAKNELFVSCRMFLRTFFEFQLFTASIHVKDHQLWCGGHVNLSLSLLYFQQTSLRTFFVCCKLHQNLLLVQLWFFLLFFKTHVSLWPFVIEYSFCLSSLSLSLDCFLKVIYQRYLSILF